MTRSKSASGIVVFRPESGQLMRLVLTLLRDTERVYVYVNKVIDPDDLARLQALGAQVIHAAANFGVAEGLNTLALAARLDGFDRILLMDQDSRLPDGLAARLGRAMDDLRATGVACAAVGPQPAAMSVDYKAPRYFRDRRHAALGVVVPVLYLITSGTLLDLAAFMRVGTFRSDFFIDAIDTEWCFRARAVGFSVWCVSDEHMTHPVGDGVIRPRWLGSTFPRQRVFRYYSYFRNQAYCLRLPHVPLWWRIQCAAHLLRVGLVLSLSGKSELSVGACLLPAVWSGLRCRLGPPPGAEEVIYLPGR